jgi:hypothetical protein
MGNHAVVEALLDNCTKSAFNQPVPSNDVFKAGSGFSLSDFFSNPETYMGYFQFPVHWKDNQLEYTFDFSNRSKTNKIAITVSLDIAGYVGKVKHFMRSENRSSLHLSAVHLNVLQQELSQMVESVRMVRSVSADVAQNVNHVHRATMVQQVSLQSLQKEAQPILNAYHMEQIWTERRDAFKAVPGVYFFYQSLSQGLYAHLLAHLLLGATDKIGSTSTQAENILQGALEVLASGFPVFGAAFKLGAMGVGYAFDQYKKHLSEQTCAFFLGCKNYQQMADKIATTITECCLELCEGVPCDPNDPAPVSITKLVQTALAAILVAVTVAERDEDDTEDDLIQTLYRLFVSANIFHAYPDLFLKPILALPTPIIAKVLIKSDESAQSCCIMM